MNSGSELPSKMKEIEQHFKSSQAPIMMGTVYLFIDDLSLPNVFIE